MDATVSTLCIVLQPWAGHRRGATVAVLSERAAPLIKRGVLELIARVETPATLATLATNAPTTQPAPAAPIEAPQEARRRGRHPRAK